MENKNENKIPTPIELFGVECGKGWYKLIEPIIKYIEEYNQDKKEEDKIKIIQIKEKFGELRFYTNFGTEELHKMIEEAEEKSYNICEKCGSEKYVGSTTQGWVTTICIDCLIKRLKESKYIVMEKWYNHSDQKLYEVSVDNIEEILKKIKN